MENAIEVKNLGKKYTIGKKEKYLTIRDTLVKAIKIPRKLIQGQKFNKKEEFWALKNVNFKVKKGEVVGIIGRNGAGKSTLLKILSRITEPTEGEVKMKGRVSSMLEVGTGFHPELTGRENIYLNGAVLGMPRKEIDDKFEEILKFSGVVKFLDMPIKKYSSGMQVRLAFSIAAHLEPDVLLIDEVLAVGDTEFQKKCLGKMEEVAKGRGRTILFVSHDMSAIQRICKTALLLENGIVRKAGTTKEVINHYLSITKNDILSSGKRPGNKKWEYKYVKFNFSKNTNISTYTNEDTIFIEGRVLNNNTTETAVIAILLYRDDGLLISKEFSKVIEVNDSIFSVSLKNLNLFSGSYFLKFWLGSADGSELYDCIEPGLKLEFINKSQRLIYSKYSEGVISLDTEWLYE